MFCFAGQNKTSQNCCKQSWDENSAVPPRLAVSSLRRPLASRNVGGREALPALRRSNSKLGSVARPLFAVAGSQPVTRVFCRHVQGAVSFIAFNGSDYTLPILGLQEVNLHRIPLFAFGTGYGKIRDKRRERKRRKREWISGKHCRRSV